MSERKQLTPKQDKIIKIIGLSMIPLVLWLVYDINNQYQVSEKYGGEYVRYGWIEENTSCNYLKIQIGMKEGTPFTPNTHIPALQEWYDKLDCNNPDSRYYRSSDYSYDFKYGTNLQGEKVNFLEFEEWIKQNPITLSENQP